MVLHAGPGRSRVSVGLSQGCCWFRKGGYFSPISCAQWRVCLLLHLLEVRGPNSFGLSQGSAKSAGGNVSANLNKAAGDAQGKGILRLWLFPI